MGKRVFVGWALWQKLTFCLALAIVVVILLGCIKLGYTHWRLRRLVNVAEKERQEQSMHRQMSQRRQSKPKNSDETPFGVRALESGVEVEGVWISRPNTPDSGSQQSSAVSMISQQHHYQRSTDVDLEKGQLHEHKRTLTQPAPAVTRPVSTVSRPVSTISGSALSADRNRRSYASRDSSVDGSIITVPPRSRHPPNSYTKWAGIHPSVYRHSSSMSTLEGLEAIHKASTSLRGDDSSETSESSSGGTDHSPISASAPGLLTGEVPTRIARPRKHSVDLDMLNSHRQSMAAETGQLRPRVRKPNHSQSRDSSIASIPASVDREYYASSRNPPDTSPSDAGSPTNPFSTPKINALPDAVRRSSMPDVTPFAQFCQTAPPTSRPTSSNQASSPHMRASSDTQSLSTSSTSSPISPMTLNPLTSNPPEPATRPRAKRSASENRVSQVIPEEPATRPQAKRSASENRESQVIHELPATQPQAKRSSFEKRESQVIRGEGSGFEILKPGSLAQASNTHPPSSGPPEKVSPQALRESMQRQRAAPPISLHNTYRPRSSSADSRKKLQKRRRPSVNCSHWSEDPGSGGNRKSVFL